jgi:hypothetical protein
MWGPPPFIHLFFRSSVLELAAELFVGFAWHSIFILILERKLSINHEFRDKRLDKSDHSLDRVPGFLPVLFTYLDRVGLNSL